MVHFSVLYISGRRRGPG